MVHWHIIHNNVLVTKVPHARAVMRGKVKPETDQERELLALAPFAYGRYIY